MPWNIRGGTLSDAEDEMTSRFWVVMGPNGMSNFPYRHPNEISATLEAQRLARTHGGCFWVLQAVGAAERVDVRYEQFNDDDQIPF